MKEYLDTGNLQCFWSNLNTHPKCIHGPTLLFGRENNGTISKFYVCSACRDRKLCPFYMEHGKDISKQQLQLLDKEKKKNLPSYHHQRLFILFNNLLNENSSRRAYCHTCEKLMAISEKQRHNDHEIIQDLTDYQMMHPSEILKPLENSKKEAQYLFSKKAVKDITDLLINLNAESVLCIGAPRIHEYITHNLEGRISSLLLDLDGRFHNFFGPLNFCWYNLFNHHFFQDNSENVFKDFLRQNNGKNMYLICDPPFGGRVEPISQTIKAISDLHKRLNKISISENELKIIFIFPYYMESIIKEKSNPPEISGGLKDLKMADYKVEYDNHPLFVSKANNQKQGSQVRIFTNIPLNVIKLPETDGYKYCKRCERWVAAENKHCKICRNCTSKDGRRYRHCKICQRCVKPTWQHCKTCDRCFLPNHKCGQKPKIGNCFKCGEIGHTGKECSKQLTEASKMKKRKRKEDNFLEKEKKLKLAHNNLQKKKDDSKVLNSKSIKSDNERLDNTIIKKTSNRIDQSKSVKISKNSKLSDSNLSITRNKNLMEDDENVKIKLPVKKKKKAKLN